MINLFKNLFFPCSLLFFITFLSFAQNNKIEISDEVLKDELLMKMYPLDKNANALVLFESGNYYIDEDFDYDYRTDFYFRIKIFNKNAFNQANISIPVRKGKEVIDIKASSYNLENNKIEQTKLNKKDVFEAEDKGIGSTYRFTIPNIRPGSVIEYSYSILSQNPFIDDWYFQSNIPKLKSEFKASLLANYKYNITLFGFNKLSKQESEVKKNCLTIPGFNSGGCLIYKFAMEDVPAFLEEKYMLHVDNYISRIEFNLMTYKDLRGVNSNFSNTWENSDKSYKKLIFDNQIDKINYFRKQLPEEFLSIKNDLERAKKTYNFIKNKFTWNNKYSESEDLNVKEAFKTEQGPVDAINITLYNCLKAVNIDAKVVLAATREIALPTKDIPKLNNFNYTLVTAIIDETPYYLDASDKNLIFGQIPEKCINGDGRVLDFENGSYWVELEPKYPSISYHKFEFSIADDFTLSGTLDISKYGYYSYQERTSSLNKTKEEYINDFQNKYPDISVKDYTVVNDTDLTKPLIQNIKLNLSSQMDNSIVLNPFIIRSFTQNPFELEERQYSIDYGYSITHNYSFVLNLPDDYEVIGFPESKLLRLPNNSGSYLLNAKKYNNKISINTRFSISKHSFQPQEYKTIKDFYNKIINIENIFIEIKKVKK